MTNLNLESLPRSESLSALLAWCRGVEPALFRVADNPFPLRFHLDNGASSEEIDDAWRGTPLPASVKEFWTQCRSATLFEDVAYGQWGLRVLTPLESAKRTSYERAQREADFLADDIVFATFLGDSDLLVVSHCETRENIVIAWPLDRRADWPLAARSLEEFILRYLTAAGNKYWEPRRLT
jgi:SMI1 / KNR4 family (SUKH-1)